MGKKFPNLDSIGLSWNSVPPCFIRKLSICCLHRELFLRNFEVLVQKCRKLEPESPGWTYSAMLVKPQPVVCTQLLNLNTICDFSHELTVSLSALFQLLSNWCQNTGAKTACYDPQVTSVWWPRVSIPHSEPMQWAGRTNRTCEQGRKLLKLYTSMISKAHWSQIPVQPAHSGVGHMSLSLQRICAIRLLLGWDRQENLWTFGCELGQWETLEWQDTECGN